MITHLKGCDADIEESAVAHVLLVQTSLCELGLLQEMRMWEPVSPTLCFQCVDMMRYGA